MSIEIRGLEQLYRKFDRVTATKTLVPPTQRGLMRLKRPMQFYPPALPPRQGPLRARAARSRRARRAYRLGYKRTGTYGKRWATQVVVSGNGVQGRLGNNTRYAPYVGSKQFQARIHQGRWNTDDQVVREEQAAIVADYQATIDKALAE